MGIQDYYLKVVRDNYSNFEGRARRSEYWYYTLANVLIGLVLAIIDQSIGLKNFGIGTLYSLAVFIPGVAVSVRRLHDVNKSGWWLLIALTGIGIFYLLYLYVQQGDQTMNEYGQDPKGHIDLDSFGKAERFEDQ